jgi:2-polyprenyl-3-methyl-5-hydroxy-6-metoxy-1,4-benzoquinol methylase
MKLLSEITFVLRSYSRLPLFTRLFILLRYIVCPWNGILGYLTGTGSVLDIGCGHGLLLHLAKRKFPDLSCTGFDHDKRKIDVAIKSTPRRSLTFLLDSEIDRLTPSSFDCVTLVDVLYSVPTERWSDILSLANKYLKPHGTIIIKETVNRPKWKYYICLIQETVALRILRYTKGHSPRLESVDFYLAQIAAEHFVVQEHRRIDSGYLWPHYLFVGKKRDRD